MTPEQERRLPEQERRLYDLPPAALPLPPAGDMTPEEERRLNGKVCLADAISPEAKRHFEILQRIDDPAAKQLCARMKEQTITEKEVQDIAAKNPELLQPARDALVIAKALDVDCKDLVSDAEEILEKNPAATDADIAKILLQKIANSDVVLISAVAQKLLKEGVGG
jgi:hypothetical protein